LSFSKNIFHLFDNKILKFVDNILGWNIFSNANELIRRGLYFIDKIIASCDINISDLA
jgi:hypothetical protein